jgi:small conductance mechanosensitive channel
MDKVLQLGTALAIAERIGNFFLIGIAFLLAWVVHHFSDRLAKRIMHLGGFAPKRRQLRSERLQTMQGLISSTVSFLALATAVLFSVGLFVGAQTLVWMVGLFSAAFGLGARPLISDFLTGISFLFEDTFDVGEKVEIMGVEGVVEQVNLRTTLLRAPTGELFVIPNGEVRAVRNFSRGRFSTANITLKVATADLNRALRLLQELSQEAVYLLPNLLEPWQVISESGAIGQQTELTLVTKTRFGQAAEMRPRLLALVQERLSEAEIALVN